MKKKIIKLIFVFTIFVSGLLLLDGCGYSQLQQVQGSSYDSTSMNANSYYQDNGNYDQTLNNYGDWIMINPYGNVWKPFVAATWQPYYYGHWVYSDYGWTWVSYEPFGWIVYHYGFWVDNPYYGWLWVPSNNQWSPANVEWYDYGNYVCWAPLPPEGITYSAPWESDRHVWRSVQYNDFTRNDVSNYFVSESRLRNDMGGRSMVSHRAPNVKTIETRVPGGVPVVKIQKENVKRGNGKIIRMQVPKDQQKIIERHAPEIQRIVTPRQRPSEQQKQQNNPKKKERQNKQGLQSFPGQGNIQSNRQSQPQNFTAYRPRYDHRPNFRRHTVRYQPQPARQRQPQNFTANRPGNNHQPNFQRPAIHYHPQPVRQRPMQNHATNVVRNEGRANARRD